LKIFLLKTNFLTQGFEKVISELRENLINNKEFLDSLKLEKNDLQSKFNKLQKVTFDFMKD